MIARARVDPLPPASDPATAEVVQRGGGAPDTPTIWRLSTFAGRLGEVSGSRASAVLTMAFRLVLEAQRRGEPVAWIAKGGSIFYPPDVAESAVDLGALVVVQVPETRLATRVADQLVRSGAFGLVVLDLGPVTRLPAPAQARLAALARKHDAVVLCLTEKDGDRPSLGSLVSIRTEVVRSRSEEECFRCKARALKDKRRGPGWTHVEVCRGPDGLH